MLRLNGLHILSMTLACLGAAAWAQAVELGSEASRWGGVALWLTAAGCATFEMRAARRARAAIVRQLRQAAAAIRPDDARFDAASVDAESFGAAVDGLIAATRVQRMTLDARVRELELTLRAATLERDRLSTVVAEMAAAARAVDSSRDRTTEVPSTLPKRVAVRRRQRAALARESARLKRDFVSLLSHKFRTPLASIRAYTEMLIDGEAADDRSMREFLDVIHAEADRLGQSIDNVLSLVRLDAGLTAADLRPMPVGEVVDAALAEVRSRAQSKRVELDVYRPEAGDDVVLADRQLLGQAVANLLENAVKFTPEGGRVTVRTSVPAAGAVALRVEDTGIGIDPKVLHDLFDNENGGGPDSARADSPQGRPVGGLGLAVARRVVESVHGGRLTVESRTGQGSSFTIELGRQARGDREASAAEKVDVGAMGDVGLRVAE